MTARPLVSVLMGAYNCAHTLGASIDSILGQSYTELELIVCDDGSIDGTFQVIEGYAQQDPRVIPLRNDTNRGLAYTLNRCIEVAKGEYIARMDGDDISRSDRIQKQVTFLEAHPDIDICGSSVYLFDESGTWGKNDYPEHPNARSFLMVSPFVHPTVVFRSRCLREAGGYSMDPAVGRSEDYDLFMRLYASGSRGYNIQEYLLGYREEPGSYKRRKFRYALAEARVRLLGFRRLGLLPQGMPFVVKPIFVGLLPKRLYVRLRRTIFGKPIHDA